MKKRIYILPAFVVFGLITGCGDSHDHSHGDHDHSHGEHGHSHGDHDHEHGEEGHKHEEEGDHEHEHEEVALGTFDVSGVSIEAAQGHGDVEAGKESHLVVKLPYNDKGASSVRVWIGTEDRTLSVVGKAEYAASHDDYDVHATAPDPLPEGASWWIEIEKPDGEKVVGSIPFLKDIKKG